MQYCTNSKPSFAEPASFWPQKVVLRVPLFIPIDETFISKKKQALIIKQILSNREEFNIISPQRHEAVFFRLMGEFFLERRRRGGTGEIWRFKKFLSFRWTWHPWGWGERGPRGWAHNGITMLEDWIVYCRAMKQGGGLFHSPPSRLRSPRCEVEAESTT